jgi:hypothetical protein
MMCEDGEGIEGGEGAEDGQDGESEGESEENEDDEDDESGENDNDEAGAPGFDLDAKMAENPDDDRLVIPDDQLKKADDLKYEDKLACLLGIKAMGFDITEELKKIQEDRNGPTDSALEPEVAVEKKELGSDSEESEPEDQGNGLGLDQKFREIQQNKPAPSLFANMAIKPVPVGPSLFSQAVPKKTNQNPTFMSSGLFK